MHEKKDRNNLRMSKIIANFAKCLQSETRYKDIHNLLQKQMEQISAKKAVMVQHGVSRCLQRVLNVSHVTVRRALKGELNTETARKIRHVAVSQYGGIEYSPESVKPKIKYL